MKINHSIKDQRVLAWILLIILSLIWGSSFILIKKGLHVYNATEVGALRIITAGIFLSPIAIQRLGRLTQGNWQILLVVGFVGSLGPAFLFATAQTHLASSITGVINALTPLFTALIGAVFFNGKISKRMWVGILIGFTGTLFLILAGSNGGLSGFNFYAFFVVVATIMYGSNLNIVKVYLVNLSPITITSVSLLLILPLALIILASGTHFSSKILHQPGAWEALGYISILGVIGTSLALILFNKMVQISSPLFTSSVTYIIPIIAVSWGLLDGEILMFSHLLGMLLILIGVFIANRR